MYQEFDWLLENAAEFGFMLTYPPDQNDPESGRTINGYEYEPWHWRFMGNSTAAHKYMKDADILDKVAARRYVIKTHDYGELLDRAIQID